MSRLTESQMRKILNGTNSREIHDHISPQAFESFYTLLRNGASIGAAFRHTTVTYGYAQEQLIKRYVETRLMEVDPGYGTKNSFGDVSGDDPILTN